ncbi:hypothetical protein SAMN05216223_109131 [Actinacidiphila yanglinensis]|uniref:Secreted protein n=1 Tax=Actinacidiphila yanglinensis TaxID=310779 RepID=A0A1H6CLE1_9ACTN|nr:DUF6167 family protein [Actinacidiphila yanglinensis]SEG73577.1 hypothetical protein SAMN05216223_109131 [Actinacidiphila yanglinensis]
MLRRLFWFLSGAATGAWATVKVGRAVRRLNPDSLAVTAADRALETGARLRLFAQDVRVGMAQRETELHDALGLRAQGAPPAPEPLPSPRATLPGSATSGDPSALPARGKGGDRKHKNRKDEH